MADALCGPSNALQNLQKHTQSDRTLQQDRLAFRSRQNENFRTSPGPSGGQLDAEFDAFQAGQPIGFQAHHHPLAPAAVQHPHHPIAQPGLPAWAADFQQLNIHEARQSPIPVARFRQEAPLQRSSGTSWHAEFLRQDGTRTATPPMGQQQQQQNGFGQTFMGPMGGAFGTMNSFTSSMVERQQQQQQQQQQQMAATQKVDMFDDAAFAAAFDNAAAIVGQSAQTQDKGKAKESENKAPETEQEQFSLDHACVEAPEPFFTEVDEELASRIYQSSSSNALETDMNTTMASDSAMFEDSNYDTYADQSEIKAESNLSGLDNSQMFDHDREVLEQEQVLPQEEEEMQDKQPEQSPEADELSRTAGQLLDNLKHEQGEKFANSNFMALMRQLRDREVRVEGDNFVETAQALHPGGPTYPHDAFEHRPPRVAE